MNIFHVEIVSSHSVWHRVGGQSLTAEKKDTKNKGLKTYTGLEVCFFFKQWKETRRTRREPGENGKTLRNPFVVIKWQDFQTFYHFRSVFTTKLTIWAGNTGNTIQLHCAELHKCNAGRREVAALPAAPRWPCGTSPPDPAPRGRNPAWPSPLLSGCGFRQAGSCLFLPTWDNRRERIRRVKQQGLKIFLQDTTSWRKKQHRSLRGYE